MDPYSMNMEAYNRFGKEWHEKHRDDDWWKPGTERFLTYVKKGDSILDAGCGAGTKSRYLVDRGYRVTGIDFSKTMIDLAKAAVPEAEFQVRDLTMAWLLPDTYDAFFAQASLLHVPRCDVSAALCALISRLRTGGFCYVAVKERGPGKPEEETKTNDDIGGMPRFFSYFTMGEIKEFFEKCALRIVHADLVPSGRMNWIQVIGQK